MDHTKDSCSLSDPISIPGPNSDLGGLLSSGSAAANLSVTQRSYGPGPDASSDNSSFAPWISVSNKRSGRKSPDVNRSKSSPNSSPISDPKRPSHKV